MIMKGCGLDVHQATVVACIQRQGYDKQIKTFGLGLFFFSINKYAIELFDLIRGVCFN